MLFYFSYLLTQRDAHIKRVDNEPRPGQDRTGQNRTRQDRTRQDSNGQCSALQNNSQSTFSACWKWNSISKLRNPKWHRREWWWAWGEMTHDGPWIKWKMENRTWTSVHICTCTHTQRESSISFLKSNF